MVLAAAEPEAEEAAAWPPAGDGEKGKKNIQRCFFLNNRTNNDREFQLGILFFPSFETSRCRYMTLTLAKGETKNGKNNQNRVAVSRC